MSGRTDSFGDPLPEGAVARLGTMRLRQPLVRSLAFSSDGKTLASGGDRPVHLWDVETGRLLHTLDPGGGTRWSVAFEDNGTLGGIAAGSTMVTWSSAKRAIARRYVSFARGTLGWQKQWVAVDRGQLQHTSGHGPWSTTPLDGVGDADVAVGFGGRRVAVAIDTGDVRIFSVPAGTLEERIPCGGIATAVAVSASGGTLAAGFSDGRIGLWDIATRRQFAEWPAHSAAIDALAFSPDQQTLASGSAIRIRLWNPASGGERLSLPTPDEPPARLSFHPDAPRIVTRSGLLLQEWDPETGSELSAIAARGGWDDGSRLPESRFTLVPGDAEWELWDTATGRQTLRIPRDGDAAAVSADGTLFATSGRAAGGLFGRGEGDPTVKLLELPSGKLRWTHPVPTRSQTPTSLRFLPGGEYLLAGETYDRIELLETRTGEQRRVLQGPVAFSRDGELLAWTAPGDEELPARRVEIAKRNRNQKRGWESHLSLGPAKGAIRAMAFAPFRPLLAIATDAGGIDVRNLDSPRSLHVRFGSDPVHELVFSADARRLASVSWSSAEVLVWDVPA